MSELGFSGDGREWRGAVALKEEDDCRCREGSYSISVFIPPPGRLYAVRTITSNIPPRPLSLQPSSSAPRQASLILTPRDAIRAATPTTPLSKTSTSSWMTSSPFPPFPSPSAPLALPLSTPSLIPQPRPPTLVHGCSAPVRPSESSCRLGAYNLERRHSRCNSRARGSPRPGHAYASKMASGSPQHCLRV